MGSGALGPPGLAQPLLPFRVPTGPLCGDSVHRWGAVMEGAPGPGGDRQAAASALLPPEARSLGCGVCPPQLLLEPSMLLASPGCTSDMASTCGRLLLCPPLSVRKLAVFDTWSALAVHVAMDNTVVMEDISK